MNHITRYMRGIDFLSRAMQDISLQTGRGNTVNEDEAGSILFVGLQ